MFSVLMKTKNQIVSKGRCERDRRLRIKQTAHLYKKISLYLLVSSYSFDIHWKYKPFAIGDNSEMRKFI